jgi:FkbM family methyltransferase
MEKKVIYDIGLHRGEDSEFYLRKGFRVVGIDANPDMCLVATERLGKYITSGSFQIVNVAIAPKRGAMTFYQNELSEWGTVVQDWAARNSRLGFPSREITVEAMPLSEIFPLHGAPYFMKVDIEGMDQVAVSSLLSADFRPNYLSFESEKASIHKLEQEFLLLDRLGYDRFKVVAQHEVVRQVAPNPAREGMYVDHAFQTGASGLFGEEAPGEWMSAAQALRAYKSIFWKYRLYGDDPVIGGQFVRRVAHRLGFDPGWYDTHAKHSSA